MKLNVPSPPFVLATTVMFPFFGLALTSVTVQVAVWLAETTMTSHVELV